MLHFVLLPSNSPAAQAADAAHCLAKPSSSEAAALIANHMKYIPIMRNHSEEEVWHYLRHFVGNMTVDELCTFLRFVTGSFVISIPSISVSFNTLDGLARRPISHTCSALLELPSTYTSLPTFVSEFCAILADDLYSWRMDAL